MLAQAISSTMAVMEKSRIRGVLASR